MATILSDRNIIKISGEDALKFLQNLVTNDVALCDKQEAIYAMMLSPQGRFLFDMFIIKNNGEYYLDIFSDTKELLLKKLSLYKINLKVKIEDISDKYTPGYSRTTISGDIIIYKDPRLEKLGYRLILSLNWIQDQVRDDNADEYLEDKYKYSVPDGGVDLLYDKAMPQEYRAEEMNAISYTKGCYVGQEVISRTKYQGQVRKRIYKVTSEQTLAQIQHGTEITSNGKKIGIFLSGYHNKGMALIRIEDLAASAGKILLSDREIILGS